MRVDSHVYISKTALLLEACNMVNAPVWQSSS